MPTTWKETVLVSVLTISCAVVAVAGLLCAARGCQQENETDRERIRAGQFEVDMGNWLPTRGLPASTGANP